MNKDIEYKNVPQKCTCVPSGRCHERTLIGCPHPHYYNDKNMWTCGIDPTANENENNVLTIDRNPWGEYIVRKKF